MEMSERFTIVNDDAVACYLLGAAESLNESRNNGLECKILVGSKSSGIRITLSIVSNSDKFQPSPPVLSSIPIVESQSSHIIPIPLAKQGLKCTCSGHVYICSYFSTVSITEYPLDNSGDETITDF